MLTISTQLTKTERDVIAAHLQDVDANTLITAFFDARGLSCPMPLLKAKLSLRNIALGGSLYLIASDKNSQNDLVRYCQKNKLAVQTWETNDTQGNSIFHFIITKTV
ncbi:sulfurtransferase TusA family protein [Moraxella nasovis]|uniref:sulfurtransferase TusA family protein n=1 Tax=Moraxella nasovis TaxID=2904121 RepID=UPI001F616588|nr:sulfurtransferase TusA family protein [Moraxella nasovis]UNU73693.1 sulfurtransferase TusA family protein [Moraxella nasovis]